MCVKQRTKEQFETAAPCCRRGRVWSTCEAVRVRVNAYGGGCDLYGRVIGWSGSRRASYQRQEPSSAVAFSLVRALTFAGGLDA